MHSKAVAATSQVFDTLVNGGMSEAQTRSAELKDVDEATFVRFLEYAYRHEYTDPPLVQDASSYENPIHNSGVIVTPSLENRNPVSDEEYIQEVVEAPSENAFDWGDWTNSRSAPSAFGAVASSKKSKKHSKNLSSSRSAFNMRQYVCPTFQDSTAPGTGNDAQPLAPSMSFALLFLTHARLYTLADMRMIYPLKELALHKLHKALIKFELHPQRLGDVVELARYAYDHGEDRSADGRIDALRDMIVNYVACEMKVLGKHAEFRDLMDSGGEFAGDFWDIVSRELL